MRVPDSALDPQAERDERAEEVKHDRVLVDPQMDPVVGRAQGEVEDPKAEAVAGSRQEERIVEQQTCAHVSNENGHSEQRRQEWCVLGESAGS